MRIERKQDLSLNYFMQNVFSSIPEIRVLDDYPNTDLVPPTVVVMNEDIFITPHEMGNRTGKRLRLWLINVYGVNKAQRDEMASMVLDVIDGGVIPVYNYDEGFPPNVSPTQIGALKVIEDSITATPVRIFPELVEKLYWRMSVRFITEYEVI